MTFFSFTKITFALFIEGKEVQVVPSNFSAVLVPISANQTGLILPKISNVYHLTQSVVNTVWAIIKNVATT